MLPPIPELQPPFHSAASHTIKHLKRAAENGRGGEREKEEGAERERRGKSSRFIKLITDCF
jgi:hypothetical protein